MPDAILDAIDGALRDYGTSADAMRWTPAPTVPPPLRLTDADAERLVEAARAMGILVTAVVDQGVLVTAVVDRYAHAFRQMGRALEPLAKMRADYATRAVRAFAHSFDRSQRSRWHHRNCRQCNPRGNPPPEAGKFAPGPKAARSRRR